MLWFLYICFFNKSIVGPPKQGGGGWGGAEGASAPPKFFVDVFFLAIESFKCALF